MTDSQLLEAALDFIVELGVADEYICETLSEDLEESDKCSAECENMNRICVLRFLRIRGKTEA